MRNHIHPKLFTAIQDQAAQMQAYAETELQLHRDKLALLDATQNRPLAIQALREDIAYYAASLNILTIGIMSVLDDAIDDHNNNKIHSAQYRCELCNDLTAEYPCWPLVAGAIIRMLIHAKKGDLK